MYKFYTAPQTLEEALQLKAQHGDGARFIAGGTDLIIELDRGQRQTPTGEAIGLIDLTRIPGLAEIRTEGDTIHLGPLVTHNQCLVHPQIVEHAFPLARACWDLASPQIRNRGTVAGNLVTASPANDLIVPLLAQDAHVTLHSQARGARTLSLADFFVDFRRVDLQPDEMLTAIALSALPPAAEGVFIKLGLRRAQAISVVSVAVVLHFDAQHTSERANRRQPIARAAIALGAVAPVVVRAPAAETYLVGKTLTETTIQEAARLAMDASRPIDDVRGSAEYRRAMVETLTVRSLRQIQSGQARAGWPAHPVMLWGESGGVWPVQQQAHAPDALAQDIAWVNGSARKLAGARTLLDSLRAARVTGVKEGCAEGECGACTVFLDGMAVMACLVPAERAWGSQVVTVEGIGNPQQMHPVQQAFVQSGGVQCGFCTPGFIMSAAKLLEERPRPTRGEAQEALTGNLCRCTGYRKIIDAVVAAGKNSKEVSSKNMQAGDS